MPDFLPRYGASTAAGQLLRTRAGPPFHAGVPMNSVNREETTSPRCLHKIPSLRNPSLQKPRTTTPQQGEVLVFQAYARISTNMPRTNQKCLFTHVSNNIATLFSHYSNTSIVINQYTARLRVFECSKTFNPA